MVKKIILSIICIVMIGLVVAGGYIAIYFFIPRSSDSSSIDLPDTVCDPASTGTTAYEPAKSQGIYYADVHQSLTLRDGPDSSYNELASLPPMTHVEITEYMDGTDFVLVKVLNGEKSSYIGYVNKDYLTPLGEPPIRVDNIDIYD